MKALGRVCAISAWFLSAGAIFGGVLIPDYTGEQLQDRRFIQDEIVRLSDLRAELLRQYENASALVQMTTKRDVQKLDSALDALRYVEGAGFRPDDPELAKLSYFQTSRKPFETGFRHNMTPAGPPGGRVSILNNKPVPVQTRRPVSKPVARRSTPPPRRQPPR